MIKYVTGNILDSEAEALVNTVNTDGIMGKGIALQFKKAFPTNFKLYQQACKDKIVDIGKLFITKDSNITSGTKYIINFPTKQSWRKPSEYSFIESGLDDLLRVLQVNNIKSIAIPPLGAGNGGLEWERVKNIIERKLSNSNIDILVYEPNAIIKEHLKTERIKLTDARALLLYVLYDLVKNGEYVSEFSSEKICYFLSVLFFVVFFAVVFFSVADFFVVVLFVEPLESFSIISKHSSKVKSSAFLPFGILKFFLPCLMYGPYIPSKISIELSCSNDLRTFFSFSIILRKHVALL